MARLHCECAIVARNDGTCNSTHKSSSAMISASVHDKTDARSEEATRTYSRSYSSHSNVGATTSDASRMAAPTASALARTLHAPAAAAIKCRRTWSATASSTCRRTCACARRTTLRHAMYGTIQCTLSGSKEIRHSSTGASSRRTFENAPRRRRRTWRSTLAPAPRGAHQRCRAMWALGARARPGAASAASRRRVVRAPWPRPLRRAMRDWAAEAAAAERVRPRVHTCAAPTVPCTPQSRRARRATPGAQRRWRHAASDLPRALRQRARLRRVGAPHCRRLQGMMYRGTDLVRVDVFRHVRPMTTDTKAHAHTHARRHITCAQERTHITKYHKYTHAQSA